MPIVSTENGEVISAIVLGFKPRPEMGGARGPGMQSGIWLDGRLDLPALPESLRPGVSSPRPPGRSRRRTARRRLRGQRRGRALPASSASGSIRARYFPPAYEVSVFPLADSLARQRRARSGNSPGRARCSSRAPSLASHFLSRRLSEPVEKLAVDSEENRAHRHRAEAALESTSQDLQRSARFSADASHQLKTPVTVLRAGLEELLAGEELSPEAREEVSALVHQTFRLAGVIEDLLLLSRMDAGPPPDPVQSASTWRR